MSNNKNIFEFLSDDESGDEGNKQKQEKRVRTRGKKQAPAPAQQQQQEVPDRSRKVIDNKHKKEYRKNTGPSARNRSKDRQSGTGISGVQRGNYRKDGAGKGNLGTVKDEIVGRTNNREEEVEEESEEEETEDTRITVEQYFANKGANLENQIQGQQQEKSKKTFDKKELAKEKLEVYQAKPEKQVAYKTKKTEQQGEYKPGYSGEAADLLNFRTGFVVDPKKKKRAPQQQQEGEAPATEAKEGEATVEAKEGEQKQKETRAPRNNNRGKDSRGPRNNNNNNNRGGDRKGPRGGKGFQTENTEDFPTLG